MRDLVNRLRSHVLSRERARKPRPGESTSPEGREFESHRQHHLFLLPDAAGWGAGVTATVRERRKDKGKGWVDSFLCPPAPIFVVRTGSTLHSDAQGTARRCMFDGWWWGGCPGPGGEGVAVGRGVVVFSS